jgi:hypothetical protein
MQLRHLPCNVNAATALALAVALTTLCLSNQSFPEARPLPSVQEVMDHFVSAIGGRDAIFKHRSMTVHGKLLLSGKGPTVDRSVYYKDGKMLYEITLPGGGQYKEGFDGNVAWQFHPRNGPAILQGDEVKSKQRDADMYYPGRILDYFRSMEVVDVTDFDGHTCYHLKGTNKWGKVNEHFYDTTSGLLVGYRFNSSWRGGSGDESVVFSEYRDFGGWLMPTRAVHKRADGEQVETIASVSFDDVADSVFTLPDEVKALLAKKPAGRS